MTDPDELIEGRLVCCGKLPMAGHAHDCPNRTALLAPDVAAALEAYVTARIASAAGGMRPNDVASARATLEQALASATARAVAEARRKTERLEAKLREYETGDPVSIAMCGTEGKTLTPNDVAQVAGFAVRLATKHHQAALAEARRAAYEEAATLKALGREMLAAYSVSTRNNPAAVERRNLASEALSRACEATEPCPSCGWYTGHDVSVPHLAAPAPTTGGPNAGL